MSTPRKWCTSPSRDTPPQTLEPSPDLILHISSSGCSPLTFTISFNKLVNINKCFPSSVSCSIKELNLRRGSWRPLVCRQDRSWGNLGTYYLPLASEVRIGLMGTEPLTRGTWCPLQVDHVIIGEGPAGVTEALGDGNHPHAAGVSSVLSVVVLSVTWQQGRHTDKEAWVLLYTK